MTTATTTNTDGAKPNMVTRKTKGLGRGLDALLGGSSESSDTEGASTTAPSTLAILKLQPGKYQPRTRMDEGALAELADSIKVQGLLQPILVRPLADRPDSYEIIAGERRFRAAQIAGLTEVPVLVKVVDDHAAAAMALIENIQREDLNPIEEARAYHRLSEMEGMSQADIAKMVDKSRSHVANLQRLLALPDDVIALVEQGALSMGHARALIGFDQASELAREAVAGKLSVRDVEKRVRSGTAKARPSRRTLTSSDPMKHADIVAVQGHLEEFLGLPVKIKADPDPRSGAVTIRYRTLDQLDLICQRLTGGDI